VPLKDFEQNFTFAVKDGNKALLSLINEGLAIVVANGTYEELYEKWFNNLDLEYNNKLIIKVLTIVLLILFISMTLIYFWNRLLQKKVNDKTKALDIVNSNLQNRINDALKTLNPNYAIAKP